MKFYIENETKKGKNKVNLCLAGKKKKLYIAYSLRDM